ncbi:MAG: transposase [Holosporaceae bacterium]|nr:transposase [Holosporaceae bacterium]
MSDARCRAAGNSTYVYGAVSAKTGSNYSASFPNVNTECMNDFLKRLSKHYQEKKIAIIMDGAGWHRLVMGFGITC